MQSRQSRWNAIGPWKGIYDKPAFLDGPNGSITISDVEGLTAALNAKADEADLARLAFTGQWADIKNKPAFGSAAFADVDNFVLAPTGRTLQVGSVPLVIAQQNYAVVFTRSMNAIPKIQLQCFMGDENGELHFAVVQNDTVTVDGFSFWLNGAPSLVGGRVEYWCQVQDQPA